MIVGTNGGKERSTRFNAMSDIDIDHNTISGTLTVAIWVGVGCALNGPLPDYPLFAGVEDSQLDRIQIADNDIEDYREAGIRISGGCEVPGNLYASNNVLDQLTISGNRIIHTDPNDYNAVGIELRGGESTGGPAQGNIIQDATVSSNTVSGNDIGISLAGGKGTGAQANRVLIAEMQANDLARNTEAVQVIDNSQGAVGNFVDMPHKLYLPVAEQNN
jgi:parallel beta-helix repeat protein